MLSTAPQLLLAIWLAHLLNRPLRAQTFFRITLLLPNVTSVVAVVVIFSQLFGRDFGMINWVLSLFGVGGVAWNEGALDLPRRHLHHDHVAVDGLQRPDLPGGDAGRTA